MEFGFINFEIMVVLKGLLCSERLNCGLIVRSDCDCDFIKRKWGGKWKKFFVLKVFNI